MGNCSICCAFYYKDLLFFYEFFAQQMIVINIQLLCFFSVSFLHISRLESLSLIQFASLSYSKSMIFKVDRKERSNWISNQLIVVLPQHKKESQKEEEERSLPVLNLSYYTVILHMLLNLLDGGVNLLNDAIAFFFLKRYYYWYSRCC